MLNINLQATLDKGRKKADQPIKIIKKSKRNIERDKKFDEIKNNIEKRDKEAENTVREA